MQARCHWQLRPMLSSTPSVIGARRGAALASPEGAAAATARTATADDNPRKSQGLARITLNMGSLTNGREALLERSEAPAAPKFFPTVAPLTPRTADKAKAAAPFDTAARTRTRTSLSSGGSTRC